MIKGHKKTVLILTIFVILSVLVGLKERKESLEWTGKVEREAEGGSRQSQTFLFHIENSEDQELTIDVEPRERSAEDVWKLLEKAWKDWQDIYLGENPSPEEIYSNLDLPEELCGGLVDVSYESSDYSVLQTDGIVKTANLSRYGKWEELTVRLSYGEYQRIERCSLKLFPPKKGSSEWICQQLEQEIQQREKSSRQNSSFLLPDSITGQKVYWEKKKEYGWVILLVLGLLMTFVIERKKIEEERRREKLRRKQFMYEYPLMVEQFSILLESGMTIRKVWERMVANMGESGDQPLYLQEMCITLRELKDGRGEKEAYERFGLRIGLMPYRKFSSILSQNLRRGTWNVRDILRDEAAAAMEMRRRRAGKAGEEASTKLLFPMLVMLILIFMVLLLPALGNL